MVPADSRGIARAPRYSGTTTEDELAFVYGAVTRYGRPFQNSSTNHSFCNFLQALQCLPLCPTTPNVQRLHAITYVWFRLFPVRSPLLRESLTWFLFLRLLRCFSSPGYLPQSMYSTTGIFTRKMGCPIRISTDQGYLHLPVVYRRLSRPSSSAYTKASTMRPWSLHH